MYSTPVKSERELTPSCAYCIGPLISRVKIHGIPSGFYAKRKCYYEKLALIIYYKLQI